MNIAAKALANQASSARRTATALRSLASPADIDPADRGVLLTAARIVDGMANQSAKQAKTAAREEARYEAAYRAALPAATAAVKTMPRTTTIERVALIFLGSYSANYLERRIEERLPVDQLREILEREVDEAARDIASSLAHKAAHPGKGLAEGISEAVEKLANYRSSHSVVRVAARFDAATTEAAQ